MRVRITSLACYRQTRNCFGPDPDAFIDFSQLVAALNSASEPTDTERWFVVGDAGDELGARQ